MFGPVPNLPTEPHAYQEWRRMRDGVLNTSVIAWRRELETNGKREQELINPLGKEARVTSGMGARNTGIPGASRDHGGIDLVLVDGPSAGAPVYAAASGRILYFGPFSREMGYGVFIGTDSGKVLINGHVDPTSVGHLRTGQRIEQGQIIARVGDSGVVSGPSLHFVVRREPDVTGLLAAYSGGGYQPTGGDGRTGVQYAHDAERDLQYRFENYPRMNPVIAGRTYNRGDHVPAAPPGILAQTIAAPPPVAERATILPNVQGGQSVDTHPGSANITMQDVARAVQSLPPQ